MLAQDDGRAWQLVCVLMYAGVMAGDSMIFALGRHYGKRLLAWQGTHHLFPPKKQARVQRMFDRYGPIVLLAARFMPGMRAPIFSTAGAMHVPYFRFVFYDGLAALVSVPIFVWFGHWLWAKFDDDVQKLNSALARTEWYPLWVAAAFVVLAIAIWRYRSTRPERSQAR
jgi:membrane protein DedA with SNARE-associated domain